MPSYECRRLDMVVEARTPAEAARKMVSVLAPRGIGSFMMWSSAAEYSIVYRRATGWTIARDGFDDDMKPLFPDGGPAPLKASQGMRGRTSGRSGRAIRRSDNDRPLSPGQEVSREIYEQYQYDGYPYRIPVSLLDRYGCVRGYAAGHVARDPDYHRAFGETADGRCLYLGLTRVKRYDDVPDGPPTWYEEYYHRPKTKGGRR